MGGSGRKYWWTDALRERLREVYCARTKYELTRGLDRMVAETRWPRWILKYEAQRLGITTLHHRRAWTAAEDEALGELLGEMPARRIARKLGRSASSVEARAEYLRRSRRVTAGYCQMDLAECLGVPADKVAKWFRRGLFGRIHRVEGAGHRVSEAHVARFLRRHPHEYDFRRVDQVWVKAILFGGSYGRP